MMQNRALLLLTLLGLYSLRVAGESVQRVYVSGIVYSLYNVIIMFIGLLSTSTQARKGFCVVPIRKYMHWLSTRGVVFRLRN